LYKQGTAVRNIRLDHDNAEYIEGKVDGQTIVIITQCEEIVEFSKLVIRDQFFSIQTLIVHKKNVQKEIKKSLTVK
jgi:hypothetical protein